MFGDRLSRAVSSQPIDPELQSQSSQRGLTDEVGRPSPLTIRRPDYQYLSSPTLSRTSRGRPGSTASRDASFSRCCAVYWYWMVRCPSSPHTTFRATFSGISDVVHGKVHRLRSYG